MSCKLKNKFSSVKMINLKLGEIGIVITRGQYYDSMTEGLIVQRHAYHNEISFLILGSEKVFLKHQAEDLYVRVLQPGELIEV